MLYLAVRRNHSNLGVSSTDQHTTLQALRRSPTPALRTAQWFLLRLTKIRRVERAVTPAEHTVFRPYSRRLECVIISWLIAEKR